MFLMEVRCKLLLGANLSWSKAKKEVRKKLYLLYDNEVMHPIPFGKRFWQRSDLKNCIYLILLKKELVHNWKKLISKKKKKRKKSLAQFNLYLWMFLLEICGKVPVLWF